MDPEVTDPDSPRSGRDVPHPPDRPASDERPAREVTPGNATTLRDEPDGDEAGSVLRALHGLSAPYRRVITLRHREHRSFEEMAQQMELPREEAVDLWFRAVEMLAERLREAP